MNKLLKFRNDNNLSVSDAAELLEVTRQTIHNNERGEVSHAIDTKIKRAKMKMIRQNVNNEIDQLEQLVQES